MCIKTGQSNPTKNAQAPTSDMETIQPYLDYFAQNPTWAIVVIFLIAFGEALLIIGLFVPSTAVLVGAGILVGSGHLEFWPVFAATAIGAIVGDQVSYWAGRFFGDRLRLMWPLNRYPQLVERGEEFVRNHGGKSIALGRFVPGVKAVVPGIVGMLGMSQIYFLSVNVSSGLVWSIAHLGPGILIGQGLALAGELSGRLGLVLLVLLVVLAIAGWLIRLFAAGVSPYLSHLLERISNWAKARNSRSMHRFGRAIAPQNPRSMIIVFFMAFLVFGIFGLVFLMSGLVLRDTMPNLDVSILTLMKEIRNTPADELMIPLTMLGDTVVVLAMMTTIVGWLVWRRAWRAAIFSTMIFAGGKLVSVLLKHSVHRARPVELYNGSEAFSFPSGHATMAAITFGVLAVLASHAMSRWSRSLVHATCGLVVISIAYSRIYLGVHWLSDVLGGLLLGGILVAAFGVAIEAIPPRRIKPIGLLGAAFLALVIGGNFHIGASFEKAEKFYAVQQSTYTISAEEWQAASWLRLPTARIDLAGKPEERFVAQWAGSLDALQAGLATQAWLPSPKWSWRDSIAYLDPNAVLGSVAPRPALHEGLKAKLTMTLALPDEANLRLTLRAYKTNAIVKTATSAKAIFLISLTQETLRKTMHAYSVPTLKPATAVQIEQFRGIVATLGATKMVEKAVDDDSRTLLITAR